MKNNIETRQISWTESTTISNFKTIHVGIMQTHKAQEQCIDLGLRHSFKPKTETKC